LYGMVQVRPYLINAHLFKKIIKVQGVAVFINYPRRL